MAIGELLKSPPLIEALCEFRFTPDTPWDWILPGRLYALISDRFPVRSQVESVAVEIVPGVGMGPQPLNLVGQGPERVQMKRDDGSALVQIGPNLLTVNQLSPYTNWPAFRGLITDVFSNCTKLVGEYKLFRIGLRYINAIPMTDTIKDLGDLITVAPHLAGDLNKPMTALYQRYELSHNNPTGTLIHQTAIQLRLTGRVLMVDLDFGSNDVGHINGSENLSNWLDGAHHCVEEAFVATLSTGFYQRLREGN